MVSCPKCKSYHISGPTYTKLEYGQESLKYRCMNCGYSTCEPTADADAASYGRLGRIDGVQKVRQ